MALQHGIEIIEIADSGVIVEEVRSSVVFLIGTAPIQIAAAPTINDPVLVTDSRSCAQFFGSHSDPRTVGYTIPQAYYLMGLSLAPLTIVVNVFDPDTMKSPVSEERFTVSGSGRVNLMPKSTLTAVKSGDGTTTYPGSAYTYDPLTGVLQITNPSPITIGQQVRIDYDKPDPSLVNEADIIGGVSADYEYTGLELIQTCRSRFGFSPKILIAPGYSHLAPVAEAMKIKAVRPRAQALIDAPPTTTIRQALESRGEYSEIDGWRNGSQRGILLFPDPYAYDPAREQTVQVPYSAVFAGIMAKTDRDLGYWYSPSSKPLTGVLGVAQNPTFDPEWFDTQANLLNEAGIVTIVHQYGRGHMTFGNRNSSYPANTQPTNFINIRRTTDMVYESLVYAMLQYLDGQLTQGFITAVRETVNEFLNVLISRQALYNGSRCYFDPSRNSEAQLAQGRPRFSLTLMSPPPVEKIEFEATLDTSLLSVLLEQQDGVLV